MDYSTDTSTIAHLSNRGFLGEGWNVFRARELGVGWIALLWCNMGRGLRRLTEAAGRCGFLEVTDLLLQCQFDTGTRIQGKGVIGQSLQTIRGLVPGDVTALLEWSRTLRPEPRAYEIVDEACLEKSFESGEDAVRETVLGYHSGVSDRRRLLLQRSYRRNRALVDELRGLYAGRCQLCGFDPPVLYGVSACCGHHVVYLSRGGKDELPNLMLVCPNHHEIIHATSAVFDFSDLHYVFPNGRREPLVLNKHFGRTR